MAMGRGGAGGRAGDTGPASAVPLAGALDACRGQIATRLAWTFVFLAAGIVLAWFRTRHLSEASALYGFSPSALIDPVWYRPDFAADFPNGEAQTLKSLVGQLYRLLGVLPLPDRPLVAFMIFAEFCTLGAGAFACARAANRSLPAWTAAAAALLLTTGTLVSCDLARWFHPYYGSAYNFAYGAGLAGVAAMLARRPVASGLAVGLSAAIHPIIGLFFGIAVGIAALLDIANLRILRLVAGGGLAFVIAAGWSLLMIGDAGVSGAAVDADTYITLTRMMSSHWFPVTLGVFGDHAYESLIPATGFMTVVAALLRPFSPDSRPRDAQIAAAILCLVLLSLVGALVSEYSGVPLLVKLALHRASSAALLIGAIVIVPRLAADLFGRSLVRAALAALLLLLPFWRDHGLPILLCVLYAAIVLLEERRQRPRGELLLPAVAICIALAVVAVFAHTAAMPELLGNANLGFYVVRQPLFLAGLALLAAARLLRLPAAAAIGLAFGIAFWVPSQDQMRDPAELAKARAFMEVQQWAHDHTAPGTLFMLDPTHAYGWREISERLSFGTLREWLYSGWIYDTKAEVLREGIERAKALGLDMDGYLARAKTDPGGTYGSMQADAARLYYSKARPWFADMAGKFDIGYFVLDKTQAAALPDLPISFENDRFAVVKAP